MNLEVFHTQVILQDKLPLTVVASSLHRRPMDEIR